MAIIHQFDVHAGDFGEGHAWYGSLAGVFNLPAAGGKTFSRVKVPKGEVTGLEIATEETVKRVTGTVGWGLAGAALLGPVGLLAGLFMGGKSKKVTFILRFKDGRKLLASADSSSFAAIQAATF